jgi:hypothetical protein
MAVFYGVPVGKTFIISGPADVTVKGGEHPMIVDDAGEFQQAAPAISALDPATVESGSADIVLKITGTNFTASSVIVFADYDEPTTFNEADGTLSTGVKPSLFAPATVQVAVRNGPARSNALDFEFTDPGVEVASRKSKANAA